MTQKRLIRVLVIDHSAFSRQAITRMLSTSPLVEVVGVARDGEEALKKTFELAPDLITLDLEMPRMDGFTFLRLVMSNQPTPVLIISGRSGDEDVFTALELGAVDFIAKPTPGATLELVSIEQELIRRVHAIQELRIENVRERITAAPSVVARSALESADSVVVFGASTGGPAALLQVFGAFASPPPCAFLVAQHMPAGFTRGLAERIGRLTRLESREAEDGDELCPGRVLVAPGGTHLEVEMRRGTSVARVTTPAQGDKHAPSVDRLFESVAKHLGDRVVSVVLTGMGDDGKRGVCAVKAAGGHVIAESEATAVIFGMPRQAILTGSVDEVVPLGEVAGSILSRIEGTTGRKGQKEATEPSGIEQGKGSE